MSVRLTLYSFLKLAFFSLLIHQFAFSSGKLETLSLSWNNLGDEGVEALAPKLSPTLQMLNLSSNKFGNAGTKALIPRLPATLQILVLSNNNIEDEGVKALIPCLPVTLRHLSLGYNPIKDAGLKDLLAWAPTTDLEYLNISLSSDSPLHKQFTNLRNRKGRYIQIVSGI